MHPFGESIVCLLAIACSREIIEGVFENLFGLYSFVYFLDKDV